LEDLVKRGHLREYIQDNERNNRGIVTQARNEQKTDQAMSLETINAIHGVIDRAQISRNTRRANISTTMMIEKSSPIKPEGELVSIKQHSKGERSEITFSDTDLVGVASPNDDPLVIKVRIGAQNVKRVMVDPGSLNDVINKNLFIKLKEVRLKKLGHPLYSFAMHPTWPLGTVQFNVKLGPRSVLVNFVVVDIEAPFNVIFGRNWIGTMGAIPSTIHQKLKYV
jgi:hypothetical protein